MSHLHQLTLRAAEAVSRLHEDEDGFSTAELLGNAALGIVALVVIWAALQQLGVDVIGFIRTQLITS